MDWDYEEDKERIEKAALENYKEFHDNVCVVCGKENAGPYDLCKACQNEPIPDYEAFHIVQLFGLLHTTTLKEMDMEMCKAYDEGDPRPVVQKLRSYCFGFGTPGRLYYNDRKGKADRKNKLTPGSPADLLKKYGGAD